MQDVINEIKAIADCKELAEVMGCVIQRNSDNLCFTLCPSHQDSHPSCQINKEYVYCYSCGFHEDAIGFVRTVMKISWIDAVKWLCDYYAIDFDGGDFIPKPTLTIQKSVLGWLGIYDTNIVKTIFDEDWRNTLKQVALWCDEYTRKATALLSHTKSAEFAEIVKERKEKVLETKQEVERYVNKTYTTDLMLRIKGED